MSNVQRVGVVAGGLLLVAAVVVAVSAFDAGGADCGSLVAPTDQGSPSSDFGANVERRFAEADCDEARGARWRVVVPAGLAGAGLVVAGVWRRPVGERSPARG